MIATDGNGARDLRFGVLDPARARPRSGPDSDAEPDVMSDYAPVSWAELLEQDLRGALVMFDPTYRCNMRCPFCTLPVTSRDFVEFGRIRSVLQSLALSGARQLVLTGGEPGIVPAFPDIVATAARLGFQVSVLTNGTWAGRGASARRIVESGIDEVVFSLKGADRASAARLAGRDFFDRQMRALATFAAMRRDGVLRRLVVNHVIAGDSLRAFIADEALDSLLERAVVLLALVEPYTRDMVQLVPGPEVLQQDLACLLRRWASRGITARIEGVPLCLLGDYAGLSRDIARSGDQRPRVLIKPQGGADHVLYYRGYQRGLQFTQPQPCVDCAARGHCPGVHRKYAQDWSQQGITPLARFCLPERGQ